jgi:SAM-dependent methyltransferase
MSYNNLFVRYYDLFYTTKRYDLEAEFIHTQIQKNRPESKNIIEFACGTGKHAHEMSRLGYNVHGYDLSASMITRAQATIPAGCVFETGDMRSCGPGNQSFDAALVLFDSLGYLISNQDTLTALKNMRRNLKPGGVLIGEVWHAPAFLTLYDPVRLKQWQIPGGRVERRSQTTLNIEKQIATVSFTVTAEIDGVVESAVETHHCRFFQVQELLFFLETAGFSAVDVFPGFQDSRRDIRSDDFHLVFCAIA